MSPSSTVSKSRPRVDSRWQTLFLAFCLALSPAVGIGFGRFAYALVLPAMRDDLGWKFEQAGTMGTANAIGYLLGALLTGPMLRAWAPRPLMLFGFVLSVIALWGAALTQGFTELLFFRALVGFGAAPAFICAAGLAAQLGRTAEENAMAMGLTICGGGIGTILTGIFVPLLLDGGDSHWPQAWGLMGGLGVAAFVILLVASKGLSSEPVAALRNEGNESAQGDSLNWAYLAYFAFGLGYIAYITFLVAFVRTLKVSSGTITLVWVSLGAAMLASSWAWKGQLARNRGGKTVAMMSLCGAICAFLPLYFHSLPALLISAIGFGIGAMPVVTAIPVLIRRHLPVAQWNGAIATATVIFATGQSIGPFVAGRLSDRFNASASLWWSVALLGVAALIALLQKPKQEHTP